MNRAANQGFSLIEILVTISIVLVVLFLSLPRLSHMHHALAKLELEKMRTLIKYTQQKALLTHQKQVITINCSNNSYQTSESTEALPEKLCFGFFKEVYGPPSKPTHLLNQAVTFKDDAIECHQDGTVTSGTIYITDSTKSCLYALTSPIADVNYIRIYRYENHAWVLLS